MSAPATASSGRMKLVFVTEENQPDLKLFKDYVQAGCQKMMSELRERLGRGVRLELSELVEIGGGEDVARAECFLTVQFAELWKQMPRLSQMVVQHWRSSNEVVGSLRFRTFVQLQDRSWFDIGKLMGADLHVKATDVYFGNFLRHDQFLCHYKVDQRPENGWYGDWEMMRDYYMNDPAIDANHTIYMDFEHDRHRMVIVFPLKSPDVGARGKIVPSVAKLELNYNTIRRIVVDFHAGKGSDHSLSLFLHLRCPPLISVVKFTRRNQEGKEVAVKREDLRTMPGDRFVHWIPLTGGREFYQNDIRAVAESPYLKIVFSPDNHENWTHILGRLYAATRKPVEVRGVKNMVVPMSRDTLGGRQPHSYSDVRRIGGRGLPVEMTPEDTDVRFLYAFTPTGDRQWLDRFRLREQDCADFAAIYMFDAIMSHGAHVLDQLLVIPGHRNAFMEKVAEIYRDDRRLALETLERLLNSAVEREDMKPLYLLFDEALRKARRAIESEAEGRGVLQRGYVRLRKVTITPSRRIYEAPELIMGNRVLRHDEENWPTDKFLRVSFRDENFKRLQPNIGAKFIQLFVATALKKGIQVANRHFNYLGSSNSQMRDQGCYFINGDDAKIEKFRQSLGSFKKESVPKLMARFGQCFTQSHAMTKDLERKRYAFVGEWTGGADGNGEPFTFSDGVGCMSKAFAKEIAQDMQLGSDFVPSCIQSRYRGCKGVHALNPNIDRIKEWAHKHGKDKFEENHRKEHQRYLTVDLYFRPSQEKFLTRRENQKYEVVKVSGPSSVCLNRPMINILDQVSALQNFNCHSRVTNRIFELLDLQLRSIARWMVDEREARVRLSEFPQVIQFDALQNLNLTSEPFFRSLLRTAARSTLNKLRSKLQIAIPASLGRSMLGVIDETGLLQYGQVFCRYTINIQQKRPGPTAGRKTVKGPVMITKNPMIVAGDVRMFEAVDIPALHYLCDVVVFPRHGPRPHTDEMAGSDLDGDEYSVIWDPGLYIDRSEDAFDYTSKKAPATAVDEENLRHQMADFFLNYITNDSIGKLATAFLVNSDTYGIQSKICENVAIKHMSAVDFPKTGIPATRLSKDEDPQRKPDFIEQYHKPNYRSQRLNGRLFRRIKEIDSVLESSIEEQLNQAPKKDEIFCPEDVPDSYMAIARTNFEKYQATMENMLNRSFFNTRRLIEEELEFTCSLHRRMFFEAFGKRWQDQLEWTQKRAKKNERETRLILKSRIREPGEDLQRLAVAYYQIAYSQENQKFLSFAWLVADVLAKVRMNRLHALTVANRQVPVFSFDPLSQRITNHMADYIQHISAYRKPGTDKRLNKLQAFGNLLKNGKLLNEQRALRAQQLIADYCRRHVGLDKLLYFVWRWGVRQNIVKERADREDRPPTVSEGIVREEAAAYDVVQLLLTYIQFGLGRLGGADGAGSFDRAFLDPTDGEANLEEQHGGLGKKLLQFLEFLATLRFANITRQTFMEFKYPSAFCNSEWIALHQAAKATYYQLCFNDSFTVLPFYKDQLPQTTSDNQELALQPAVDGESFVFELPLSRQQLVYDQRRSDLLGMITGCTDLSFRSLISRHNEMTARIVATVAGGFDSVTTLRNLLMPWGYVNCSLSSRMLDKALSSQVLHNLLHMEREYYEQKRREEEAHELWALTHPQN
ncbi:RNA-directed RNA polymerase [Aphelenchoides fujianensis]|nr:RNA-directed RNA polymerase [Aphelenchoides fujianensis]